MLHLLRMGPFKVLKILLLSIQHSRQLSLLELSSTLRPCFFWRFYTFQHWVFLFGFFQLVCFHNLFNLLYLPPPPLLMQQFRLTLAFTPPTLHPPTLYHLPMFPLHPSCFWLFSYTSCLLLPQLAQGAAVSLFSSGKTYPLLNLLANLSLCLTSILIV